jgi:hypothetical protein
MILCILHFQRYALTTNCDIMYVDILVIAYIYFTRIVVDLIESSLPYYLLWMGSFFSELAAFTFYVTTGWLFRPSLGNPYLMVANSDEEEELVEPSKTRSNADTSTSSHLKYANVDMESSYASEYEYGLNNHSKPHSHSTALTPTSMSTTSVDEAANRRHLSDIELALSRRPPISPFNAAHIAATAAAVAAALEDTNDDAQRDTH